MPPLPIRKRRKEDEGELTALIDNKSNLAGREFESA
jgi:hypothetical protein